jgi:D-tyrosyl-tRNA(Tyr) deacylase
MIALIQRVREARVDVADKTVGAIGPGILALVAVVPDDTEARAARLLKRILGYRIFGDEAGRMNRSLRDVGGGLMLVPQFTLAADTSSGTRPGFSTAAPPELGLQLFEYLVGLARAAHSPVATGRFGADMQVALVNDGPVTFWLES